MPIYEYECSCGTEFERYLRVADYLQPQICECGAIAQKVIRTPPIGFVSPNICYDSPIDGRPITSWAERQEDLARSGCQPYDPGMRQDADRRRQEADEALDKSVDSFVDAEYEKMPTTKRESLAAELESGAVADVIRI